MRTSATLFVVAMLFAGCSTRATQTEVLSPHEHRPVNTIRPGNAIGNSLVVPEPFEGIGEDTRRAGLPSTTTSSSAPDWQASAEPFRPLSGDRSAESSSSATPAQILGLEPAPTGSTSSTAGEPASDDGGASQPVAEPGNVPATVVTSDAPSWSDITATPAPMEPQEPDSQVTTEQVYLAAGALPGLSTWTVVPLAHFRRGLRHVVVAWPAMNASGETVDATVVGICLEEGLDGDLAQCGSRWVVNDRASATTALVQALGGADYEVVSRQSSAPLDALGPSLAELGNDFVDAVDRGDSTTARRLAVTFAQMLPVEQVAFDNDLAQLLWMAAEYGGRLEHVSTERSGQVATLTFDVSRGWFRVRTIRVSARTVNSDPTQWVVVDYQ